MRDIRQIIIHCSATPEGREISLEEIDRWHRLRGFTGIGYHYLVHLDGTIQAARPIAVQGAHCYGYNSFSIGICYIGGTDPGGKPKDTRTDAQRRALRSLVADLRRQFPRATVHGHNEFAAKACPCFDVSKEDWS